MPGAKGRVLRSVLHSCRFSGQSSEITKNEKWSFSRYRPRPSVVEPYMEVGGNVWLAETPQNATFMQVEARGGNVGYTS